VSPRPLTRLAAAAGTAVLLTACSSGDGSQQSEGEQASVTGTTVEIQAADEGTQVDVSAVSLPETVLRDGSEIGETSVEVRVSELLGELETRDGSESATTVVLPESVLFGFDEDELKPEAAPSLDRIVELIGLTEDDEIQVVGHTDSRGDDAYNQALSQRRAQAVVDYLTSQGVPADRLAAVGRGESEPVADNESSDGSDNPDGRAQNRRVEVLIDGLPGQD